ncbi:hypothetical protein C4D60_Mb10t08840 [Musa balbisiana]|uniref:F-box domain-containing protein n=1 Tax=Musa balbisiana TaxID=52838 RepID=A0A4V4H4P8_MUSBA|nr:hypothetical protein C4D60_Mb10t08840 [Musa balbisiana]
MEDELLPRLPQEIACECLIRVPFHAFPTVRAVCKNWMHHLESPCFHRLRRSAGLARPVVALVQSESIPPQQQPSLAPPVFRLSLFEPATGAWTSLPPTPGRSHGLPLSCRLAAVGRELVVVGGLDRRSWAFTDDVHVFDVVSRVWRRGVPMPGPRRSSFACAGSEERRMVFVAGGHDERKNALRSTLAYDVAADAWVRLPDMARERDECRGLFARGAFRVLGGFPTAAQAQFSRTAEAFDVAAWRWGDVEEGKLAEAGYQRTCVVSGDGRMCMCRQGEEKMEVLLEDGDGAWRPLAHLPGDVKTSLQMVSWEGGLMLWGAGDNSRAQVAYIMDLKGGEGKGLMWRKVEMPKRFSGYAQTACSFEMPETRVPRGPHLFEDKVARGDCDAPSSASKADEKLLFSSSSKPSSKPFAEGAPARAERPLPVRVIASVAFVSVSRATQPSMRRRGSPRTPGPSASASQTKCKPYFCEQCALKVKQRVFRKTMHVGISNSEQPKRAMVAVRQHAGNLFIRYSGNVLASDALEMAQQAIPPRKPGISFFLSCTLSVVGI